MWLIYNIFIYRKRFIIVIKR